MSIARNVKIDPRVGDIVRVIPAFNDTPRPAPLTITAVDSRFVHWVRANQAKKTSLHVWMARTLLGGRPASRMEIVGAVA